MTASQNVWTDYVDRDQESAPRWWDMFVEGDYGEARVSRGDFFEATVLSMKDRSITVELQGKLDGLVQERDLEMVPDTYVEQLEVGNRIPVRVLKVPAGGEFVITSLRQGLQQKDWLRAQRLMESGETVEVEITGTNRGGVTASFGDLQGFVPNSHLLGLPRGLPDDRKRTLKESRVSTAATVMVIEVDPKQRRLILSERRAATRQRGEILDQLHEGAIRTGVVNNLVDFGAFIDLGGVDGLLHISEIAWEHVLDPKDQLTIGQQVEVYVLSVDRERERISLSRKRLLPDPWDEMASTLHAGDSVWGPVTNVTTFGAFVQVRDGIEGLVHVSEMPNEAQTLASLVPGVYVKVMVLDVDPRRKRISLRLEEEQVEDVVGEDPAGEESIAELSVVDVDSAAEEPVPEPVAEPVNVPVA